jgi:indolepyruvate ferredoxin oxidoreductase
VESIGARANPKRLLEVRVPDLIAYQDEAYARRYAEVVKRVVAAEQKGVPGSRPVRGGRALPVQADGLQGRVRGGPPAHRPGLPGRAGRQFPHGYSVKYNLAPPLLWPRPTRRPVT